MKILHCLKKFFPDNPAGTEIYVEGLCKALQNIGIEVAVVKPSFDRPTEVYFHNGIRVLTYLETSKATAELQSGLKAPNGLINFRLLLKKENPDAIHFHEVAGSNGITIYHVIAAREMGIPVFSTFHLPGNICMRNTFLYKGKVACNGVIDKYKCAVCILQKKGFGFGIPEVVSFLGIHFKHKMSSRGIGKLFNYPLYVKLHAMKLKEVNVSSEKVFVLSNWYKSLLIQNGFDENKIVVLPAAISSNKPAFFVRKNKKEPNANLRFVYAGRISHIKGLHILIEALSNLNNNNWELDIYGPITENDYYDYCRKISVNNSAIHWKGVIEHDKVISTLSEYDALVFPSLVQETMGLIMLEAFAAGVPVIGSSIWSVNEHIEDNLNGLVFKTGDSNALESVLEKVINDPSLLIKMSANIKFPPYIDEVAKTTFSVYHEVLNLGQKENENF